LDLAPGAIEIARREAGSVSLHGIRYEVADLNLLNLPESHYDAIWFNSSLHHVRELEAVCDNVAAALKPGGFLFAMEYVGANRFDFSARQLEAIRAALALLPERYRRSFLKGTAPTLLGPLIPNPRDVEVTDPSEAIRSSDIPRVIAERFDILVHNKGGGTLLQYLLHGIAGNFRSDDADSLKVLDMLFRIEDTLIDSGDLPSDFDLIVARKPL
jgi:SAM-dependent methyltransferase